MVKMASRIPRCKQFSSSFVAEYRCILHASFPETNAAGTAENSPESSQRRRYSHFTNRGVPMKKLLLAFLILTVVTRLLEMVRCHSAGSRSAQSRCGYP